MKKKILWLIIIAIIIVILCAFFGLKKDETRLISVKSKSELMQIYEGNGRNSSNIFIDIATMPFSILTKATYSAARITLSDYSSIADMVDMAESGESFKSSVPVTTNGITSTTSTAKSISSSEETYSTTNIQVENVDEADIIKNDGDYIYSISEDKVVITNVKNASEPKIEARIEPTDEYIPNDLILYNNKLVVVSTRYINYSKSDTFVNIYNIAMKSNPKLEKSFVLYEDYYTSRCIDGKLIIISSGRLRKENDEISTYYQEDNIKKETELSDIKYINNLKTQYQTLIASYDLNKVSNVDINSYLFNIKNAYVSEENMYLLDERYENDSNAVPLRKLFGLGGIIGFIKDSYDLDYDYNKNTHIYKFNIKDDGSAEFDVDTKVRGTTIDQFSLDEYNGNLRIGLYTTDGSRVVVFDNNLNKIGETDYLSKGEKMYSTRFIGNKAYMVTYKTIDPLYVIDLSSPTNPIVLGKLKIPGYSTYLHPYDETHIIGIGMETKENINRDSSGKVISTSAVITGMKMALFDVSNVNKPIQISNTIIGDSRTTSAVLTNHKALLFSKEKELIAIPVNNYPEDFSVTTNTDNISTIINSYRNYNKNYTSEGYLVYNLNLTEGFKLKGKITHEKASTKTKYSNIYVNTSKLLRGLWINNNLFTVSESMLKVNDLETLNEIVTLNISGETNINTFTTTEKNNGYITQIID